jgi:hypothetical protein
MPLYEYICETDGAVIELLRPMAEADRPVPDPEGKGRIFRRKHSTFSSSGAAAGSVGSKGGSLPIGGGCACGKPHGSCHN